MSGLSLGRPDVEALAFAPPAGGEAGLADIAGAAFREGRLAENANSAYVALEEAYANRIAAIKAATGVSLEHPLLAAEAEWRRLQTERPPSPFSATPAPTLEELAQQRMAAFAAELQTLAGTYPQAADAIAAARPLTEDARALAAASDETLARLMQSRPGWDKWAAAFAGGGAAALGDPFTLGSLAVGGGPSAARTIGARILTVAAREALINAGSEAAIQPMVQQWRAEAGLDAGFDQALANVLFAGGLGFVFGGSAHGLGEAIGLLRARRIRAPETVPPEVRGALDMFEAGTPVLEAPHAPLRPSGSATAAGAARQEALVERAKAEALAPELPPLPVPDDEAQVARVVAALAPRPESIAFALDPRFEIRGAIGARGQPLMRWNGTEETPQLVLIPKDAPDIWEAADGLGGSSGIGFVERPDAIKIAWSGLPEDMRGQGIGVAMYEQLLAYAQSRGKVVVSDDNVSPAAQHIYEALARRGHDVRRSPHAVDGPEAGSWKSGILATMNGEPVFTVVPKSPHRTAAAARFAELTGKGPAPAARRPRRPLAGFVRTLGGVDPASPLGAELRAAGLTPQAMPGLFRKGGRKALDNIPFDEVPPELRTLLRPDENGYADQQAFIDALASESTGSPSARGAAGEAERVASLDAERAHYERLGVDFAAPDAIERLAAVLETEARYAAPSDERVRLPEGADRRAYTEEVVRALHRRAPGADDGVLAAAANLVLFEGESLDDALDFALATKAASPAAPAAREPLPESGFSEVPHEPPPPDAPGGLDDPGALEDIDLAAELAALEAAGYTGDIPFEALASIDDMRRAIDESAWLESVVAACKI